MDRASPWSPTTAPRGCICGGNFFSHFVFFVFFLTKKWRLCRVAVYATCFRPRTARRSSRLQQTGAKTQSGSHPFCIVVSFKVLAHAYHAHPVKGVQGGCSVRCLASGPSCPGVDAVGEKHRSCDRRQIAIASSGAAVRRQRAFAGLQIRCNLASCLLPNPAFRFPSRVRMCGLDCIRLRGSRAWSCRGLARPGGLFCFVL